MSFTRTKLKTDARQGHCLEQRTVAVFFSTYCLGILYHSHTYPQKRESQKETKTIMFCRKSTIFALIWQI